MILSQSLGITVLCSNHVNDKTASLLFSTEILLVRADLQSDPQANMQSDLVCGCYRSLFASLDLFFFSFMASDHQNNQNFMEIICCEKAG